MAIRPISDGHHRRTRQIRASCRWWRFHLRGVPRHGGRDHEAFSRVGGTWTYRGDGIGSGCCHWISEDESTPRFCHWRWASLRASASPVGLPYATTRRRPHRGARNSFNTPSHNRSGHVRFYPNCCHDRAPQWNDARCHNRTPASQHFYSITSSARPSSVGGTSSSSAFAVLRLTTRSYLVGACTGRSAGFSPFRIRST
jgi:hypothetical protein